MGTDEVSSSFQGHPGFFAAHYAHNVRAADAGTSAYVSYWDGGILQLDISDPSDPRLVGRTMYPAGSSGDGHSMTPYDLGGTRYILQNDEDFDTTPDLLARSSDTGSLTADGVQAFWTGRVARSGQLDGGRQDPWEGPSAAPGLVQDIACTRGHSDTHDRDDVPHPAAGYICVATVPSS